MRNVSIIRILICLSLLGCNVSGKHLKQAIVPTDVQIMRYHVKEYYKSLEEFTRRLYLKNPKYEKDLEMREKKIRGIFHGGELPYTNCNNQSSHKILEAAFGTNPTYEDRVFLLSFGLVKNIFFCAAVFPQNYYLIYQPYFYRLFCFEILPFFTSSF